MKKLENSEKEYLYIVKALAILSVVCAHCGSVPEGYSFGNQMASAWLGYCGTMGVPVFYILSGYFFENNKREWKDFWKQKLLSIIIPWIFGASILWLYVVLRKGGISFEGWLKFILGNGSSFYYLTVLVLLYIIMFPIKKKRGVCEFWIFLSAINIITTSFNINFTNGIFINAYLNPLNWGGYFSAGILLKRYHYMEKFKNMSIAFLPVSLSAYLILTGIHYMKGWTWSYWSNMSVINIIVQIILCFGLAGYMMSKEIFVTHLVKIGQVSYTIYLCHQLIVGALVALTNLWDCFLLTIIRPLVVVVILYAVLYMMKLFFSKYLYKGELLLRLTGIRE